ncbi:MAG: hypothetical protein JNK60_16655 [Acidobacteria bacterium]|nr:hypothetical protein [Acidobacteriota bacterium]
MNHDASSDPNDDIAPEYDFTDAVQGKHHAAYRQGTNVVRLDPDVAKVFRDSEAVNQALRLLLNLAREQVHVPGEAPAARPHP